MKTFITLGLFLFTLIPSTFAASSQYLGQPRTEQELIMAGSGGQHSKAMVCHAHIQHISTFENPEAAMNSFMEWVIFAKPEQWYVDLVSAMIQIQFGAENGEQLSFELCLKDMVY